MKYLNYNLLRILVLLEIIACYIFLSYTKGLLYIDVGEIWYISDLQSSGNDDDVSIYLIGILYFLLFLFLIIKKWSPKTYFPVILGTLVLFLGCQILIQMGSISETILYGYNYVLLFIMLTPVFLACISYQHYRRYSSS